MAELLPKWDREWNASYTRRRAKFSYESLRRRYNREHGVYDYTDIALYLAFVYVPYQVLYTSLLEQCRMNIPLLFPKLDLLTEWPLDYWIMQERTWDGMWGRGHEARTRNQITSHHTQADRPNPNNEWNRDAIFYWLHYSNFYQLPQSWTIRLSTISSSCSTT